MLSSPRICPTNFLQVSEVLAPVRQGTGSGPVGVIFLCLRTSLKNSPVNQIIKNKLELLYRLAYFKRKLTVLHQSQEVYHLLCSLYQVERHNIDLPGLAGYLKLSDKGIHQIQEFKTANQAKIHESDRSKTESDSIQVGCSGLPSFLPYL